MSTVPAQPRYFALDNLRGIMMWLGIVLHVAVNHMITPSPIPWKDSQTSSMADLIMMFIHAFRMPLFFILAGFFVARMVEQRGHGAMLKNRLRRIGLPLLIFWPILGVLTAILALMFVHVMRRGVVGIDTALMAPPIVARMHLWFLVDLLWLSGASALLVHLRRYLPLMKVDHRLVSRWWGLVVLTLPLALIGTLYPKGILAPDPSFVPNLAELAHFGLFYAAGWVLYVHRQTVLPLLENTCGRKGLVGLVAFVASLAVLGGAGKAMPYPTFAAAFFFSCAAWFWSVGLIGAFSKYTRQTPWMRYLSDSSYWVYLVHMLGTMGFGILLFDAPLNVAGKMAINIGATSAACLLSYHLFVRHTFIGVLLNGGRAEKGSI